MNDYYRTVREEYKTKLAEVYQKTIQRQAAEGLSMSPEEKLVLIDRSESPEMQLAHFVAAKHEVSTTPKTNKVLNHGRREGFIIDTKEIANEQRKDTLAH